MKKRPFNHGPPSAKRSRTMQDSVAASAMGWNATQSHVVSAEWRVLQPGAGGHVGAVVRYSTDLLLQHATFAPGGGDTMELANTLRAAVENLGGVEAMMLQTTHVRTWPARRTPEGHRHAKRVLLPEELRSPARTWLDQEVVRDATYTEHWGDKQLWDLHADAVRGGFARALPRAGGAGLDAVHHILCEREDHGRRRADRHAGE
jgi:hypothetical protein